VEQILDKREVLDRLFMKMMFKHFLRNGAYTRDELISLTFKTSFKEYDIKEEAMGFYIYLTK